MRNPFKPDRKEQIKAIALSQIAFLRRYVDDLQTGNGMGMHGIIDLDLIADYLRVVEVNLTIYD